MPCNCFYITVGAAYLVWAPPESEAFARGSWQYAEHAD